MITKTITAKKQNLERVENLISNIAAALLHPKCVAPNTQQHTDHAEGQGSLAPHKMGGRVGNIDYHQKRTHGRFTKDFIRAALEVFS